jgi:hypothetical protein
MGYHEAVAERHYHHLDVHARQKQVAFVRCVLMVGRRIDVIERVACVDASDLPQQALCVGGSLPRQRGSLDEALPASAARLWRCRRGSLSVDQHGRVIDVFVSHRSGHRLCAFLLRGCSDCSW